MTSETSRCRSLRSLRLRSNAGIDTGDVGPWFGILGPAKLPSEIVKRLNEGIRAFVSSDGARQTYNNISQLPMSSSPEEFAQLIQSDSDRFAAIIKENNIKLPVLPGGKQYQYDVPNHQLVVIDAPGEGAAARTSS